MLIIKNSQPNFLQESIHIRFCLKMVFFPKYLALKSLDILATFESKFDAKNFQSMAQSGHTAVLL